MSKIAMLVRLVPLMGSLADKVVSWFKKDPETFKTKLIFVGVVTVLLALLSYWIGEHNIKAGVDAVIELCDEVGC